jgi:hypothetical protein
MYDEEIFSVPKWPGRLGTLEILSVVSLFLFQTIYE